MTKPKESEEISTKEDIDIYWSEDEQRRQQTLGPRINKPITDFDVKQEVNVMGEIFLKKYTVTKDVSKNVYIYNGRYWQRVHIDYLVSLAMNCDTAEHTSSTRRKATVDYALDVAFQLSIPWNQILKEEIAFHDCVYNILTNHRRPHKWEDYLNSVIPHKYSYWETCPIWKKCIDEWFETDDKKLAFQEFFGYLLCSHATYKQALLLLGESNTGKSVPCEIAKYMVGEAATCCIRPEDMDDPQLTAPIKGKKLNLVTELSSTSELSDGGFKQIISGEGIQVNQKFVDVETIVPTAKHIFATNNLPEIRDLSDGVYNRLLIIKFNKIVEKDKRDPDLIDKLKKEIEGIVTWAVEGARRLVKSNGQFTVVKESQGLLSDYKIAQNPVLNFIETSDQVIKDSDGEIDAEQFRIRFEAFKGGKEWSKIQVGKNLSKLGYKSVPKNGRRYYQGLRFKDFKKVDSKSNSIPDNFFPTTEEIPFS